MTTDAALNLMADAITEACNEMMTFLLDKNAAYGNSAAEPVRIFSRANPLEQINVRIDDKLSRLMHGHEYPGDDDEKDLLGYMLLKRAVRLYQHHQVAIDQLSVSADQRIVGDIPAPRFSTAGHDDKHHGQALDHPGIDDDVTMNRSAMTGS